MSIRARIFFIFVAAVIAGFGWLGWWITGDLQHRYSESFEEVLVDNANLLAEQLAEVWVMPATERFRPLATAMVRLAQRPIAAQIYSVEKTTADIRVYVTDEAGKLLFHSQPGHVPGADFSQWHDVMRTLQNRYGARTTEEEIIGQDGERELVSVAYVAAPIVVNGQRVGVVSIGKPKTNIDRFIRNASQQFLSVMLVTCAVALALASLLYLWVTRPLQALADYAHRVSRGETVALPAMGDNEIGRVGRAMEDMRRALEDKAYVERYVQSLTHEIKSPLTAIRASAELLAGEVEPQQRAAFVGSIERETQRLTDIADRLLELAQIERADRLEHAGPVALFQLAGEVAESQRNGTARRDLKIDTDFSGDDRMVGDPLLLRQAIDNLVRNALDFSPDHGRVRISGSADAGTVWLTVEDEGPGIPEYARDRIFDRFYSLPRPHSGRKSTGLGLNFVREVAQLHGGQISVDCPQSGARARLSLARRPPAR